MKSKTLEMTFTLPLWILIAAWLLTRRSAVHDEAELAIRRLILDDILNALPANGNWLEMILVEWVIVWIYREQAAQARLAQAGVSAVGQLPE